jgi:hypothetical protein
LFKIFPSTLFLLSFFSLLGGIVSAVAGVDEVAVFFDPVAASFDPVAALSLFDSVAVAVSLVATLWGSPESETKGNEY